MHFLQMLLIPCSSGKLLFVSVRKIKKQPFVVRVFMTGYFNFTANVVTGHAVMLVVDSGIATYEVFIASKSKDRLFILKY